MVIEAKRIIKDGKLIALFWSDNSSLFIKDSIGEESRVCLNTENLHSHKLFIDNYCEEMKSQEINSILMEKEDVNEFYKSVNSVRKQARKMTF